MTKYRSIIINITYSGATNQSSAQPSLNWCRQNLHRARLLDIDHNENSIFAFRIMCSESGAHFGSNGWEAALNPATGICFARRLTTL